MSANKPEDQGSKQSGSNEDADKELRDFDPDGQNAQSDQNCNDNDQRGTADKNPEVE